MIFRKLILLSCLAYLGLSTPIAEAIEAKDKALETRDPDGVWLDVYHSGACDSGWEDQPTSGWLWHGQCKNIEPNTFGARLGHKKGGWGDCILMFWEGENCRGLKTTMAIYLAEDRPGHSFHGNYQCIATANKEVSQEFYLQNGASSVMLVC